MGNSGSVHHMQSGQQELENYYQSNDNDGTTDVVGDFCDKSNPLMLQMPANRLREVTPLATTKTSGANSSHQIKVLPSLSENLRLRSTKNGAILHSGGTISGRKESLLSNQSVTMPLMEKSETFIAENSKSRMNRNPSSGRIMPMMQRRSQTQLEMDIRKRNPYRIVDEDVNFKRFSSNLDLRRPYMMNENMDTNSNETFLKLSKAKLKTKKRKAPPVPPSSEFPAILIDQSNDLERKHRLFKTKIEVTANPSRQQVIKRSQCDEDVSAVVMRRNLNPVFRREKSFDAKLLSSGMSRYSKNLQKEHKLSPDGVTTKRKCLPIAKTTSSLLPPVVFNKMEKSNFKMELEVATKFPFHSVTNASKSSARQRDPSEKRQQNATLISRSNRPETQSKIPQLKKTFYFGMESSKRKQPLEIRTMPNYTNQKVEILDETKNSLLKDFDEVYSLNHKHDGEMKQDNGIQLNVRPTLPRRQLEIPRFSPVAAWRTLSIGDEHTKEQNLNSTTISTSPSAASLNVAVETANTFLFEDRIHRTYRDPCPFYVDNKSGDSGISGDDGYIVEKPIQPQNLENVQNSFCHELTNIDRSYPLDEFGAAPINVVGPFLTAWTPQQDLEDEEDSSSDGGGIQMTANITNFHTPTLPHVFSLSLPREHQPNVYREKNKMDFRSLQKLKRTTSSELNVIHGGCNQSSSDSQNNLMLFSRDDLCSRNNFRSDNWVLSKTTGMAAGASIDSKNSVNCINSSNIIEGNGYFDKSVSAPPMSLGSLATGKYVMYLPNKPTADEITRQSAATIDMPTNGNLLNKYDNSYDESSNCKNIPTRNKSFSFQSSVRQIERRRLADKLSKEADQKEALRRCELEAMKRVEEEFQKKRAHEKASIRRQLRLYSMDDDNFMSLPNLNDYRAEPDGAASSSSELSSMLQTSPIRVKNFLNALNFNLDSRI